MPTITYQSPTGEEQTLDVPAGTSVMRAAITNGVRGIIGECGGQAMCATCHVYVQSSAGELPEIGPDEEEMLEVTAAPRLDTSRLGCQLHAGDVEDLVVRVPERQV